MYSTHGLHIINTVEGKYQPEVIIKQLHEAFIIIIISYLCCGNNSLYLKAKGACHQQEHE